MNFYASTVHGGVGLIAGFHVFQEHALTHITMIGPLLSMSEGFLLISFLTILKEEKCGGERGEIAQYKPDFIKWTLGMIIVAGCIWVFLEWFQLHWSVTLANSMIVIIMVSKGVHTLEKVIIQHKQTS